MDSEELTPRDVLLVLFEEARFASEHNSSATEFEAAFVKLLVFVTEHPELGGILEKELIAALKSDLPGSLELTAFCMHSIRSETVRVFVEQRMQAAQDWRDKSAMAHILAAYEPTWRGREIYEYYRSEP